MILARFYHNVVDVDIAETASCLGAHLHCVAVGRDYAVRYGDILAQARRCALECDAVIVRVGDEVRYHHVVTSIEIERIVVKVVTVIDLHAVDAQTVASEVVLHPTRRVAESYILDYDIAALHKTEEMRAGDALIVTALAWEVATATIDCSIAVNNNILHLVAIDKLYGGAVCAQRNEVGAQWDVVGERCAAIECSTVLQVQMNIALENYGAYFVTSCRYYNSAATRCRAGVNGALNGLRAELCGVAYSTKLFDVVVGCIHRK